VERGKDSCFACYRAMQNGLEVCYLVNMMDEDGKWSWVHRLSAGLLEQLFKQRIEILETDHKFNNGYWFLEISKSALRTK